MNMWHSFIIHLQYFSLYSSISLWHLRRFFYGALKVNTSEKSFNNQSTKFINQMERTERMWQQMGRENNVKWSQMIANDGKDWDKTDGKT